MCVEALVIVTSQEDSFNKSSCLIVTSQEDLLNVFFYSFSSDASQLSDETTFFDSCEKSIKWGSLWLHNCQKRPQSLHPFRIHSFTLCECNNWHIFMYLCSKYSCFIFSRFNIEYMISNTLSFFADVLRENCQIWLTTWFQTQR